MDQLLSFWLLLIILTFGFSETNSEISYVRPSDFNLTCPSQPCLLFNDYAKDANKHFLDDTVFLFLPGIHYIEVRLKLENVSNISLSQCCNDTLTDHSSVQIFLHPLVNITWSDCVHVEISGLTIVLSGQLYKRPLFSTLAFQRTTAYLSHLTLFSSSSLYSTAIRTHSSHVKIHNIVIWGARSLLGAALVAFNSTIDFRGQNYFINNTAVSGGAMIFSESATTFHGKTLFVGNTARSEFSSLTGLPQGGGIYCSNSVLSFFGSAMFLDNHATGPPGSVLAYYSVGGAISAILGSRLIFAVTADVSFSVNTANFIGGAISVSTSKVLIQGHALFADNSINFGGGGAINGGSNSTILCFSTGQGINFRNNSAKSGSGGAIYSLSSYVELNGVLFEANIAGTGGAVNNYNAPLLHISASIFVNNTAFFLGGAIYVGCCPVVTFDGGNNFEQNQASVAGAVNIFLSNVTLTESNTFLNNFASLGSGGISVSKSIASINGVSLFSNNQGQSGGSINGILSTLTIRGTASFTENTAETYGGGILVVNSTFFVTDQVKFVTNSAVGDGSAFSARNSSVKIDGNVSISCGFPYYGKFTTSAVDILNSNVSFIGQVNFRNNSAYDGGAIIVRSGRVDISGCVQFINNQARHRGGSIYALDSEVILRGNCSIFQANNANRGGAVYATDSYINMSGTQNFVQNYANRGGALAFSGSSKLILTKPVQVNLLENNASIYGGAIFYEDAVSVSQCSLGSHSSNPEICFIELSSLFSIQLVFIHNTAGSAGTLIYGGQLDKCRLYVGGGVTDDCRNRIGGDYINTPIDVIHEISEVVSTMDITSKISSEPLEICICIGSNLECEHQEIQTVRGKEFTLMAVIVGQNKGIVPSSVRTSLDNNTIISAVQRIQSTGKECTPIRYRLSTYTNSIKLLLFPDGPCRDTTTSLRELRIRFLPCPDGFSLGGSECICDERLQQYTNKCRIDDETIERSSNTFWMGTVYENKTFIGFILHPGCPFDYCIETSVYIRLSELDAQCNYNHSGMLCGSCKNSYSIAFGSLHCLPCSNAYLVLILPFCFAGIVLVAILLLLNLSVATGAINGLIFYANIIQANNSIFFQSGDTNILTVFVAWLNLDLGIETCFYHGMSTYAYTWLQFLFPFYIWFLIGLIIVVSRHFGIIGRVLGRNPIATLATLLFLSYSKLLRNIIVALSFTRLEYPDGSHKLVWLYDGNIPYFQQADHIALGVFTILVLFFLFLPYTALLLCGHWFQAYSDCCIFSWINNIKPFIDAYHAPYKRKTRYWTGFLLLVHCALFLTFAFNALGNSSVNLIAITSVTAALLAVAWIHRRIYENTCNDAFEAFFILNICIFASATYHVKETGGNQRFLAYVSVGTAFVAFVCIMLYHVYLRLHKTKIWQKLCKLNIVQCSKKIQQGQHEPRPETRQVEATRDLQLPTVSTIELNETVFEM